MTRHLFIDLEDTIITPVMDGWFNTHLVNVQKIKDIIAQFKPDHVHVFSFAIWNEAELTRFNLGTRPMIEAALKIKFGAVPTVDGDIIPACCKVMGMSTDVVDFQEMSNFWGKHEAFRLNMRNQFKNNKNDVQVMLLDDAVFNEEFTWPDLKVKGSIVNIDGVQSDLLPLLKDFEYLEDVQREPTGELYFRHDTGDSTVKENETIAFFIEEELNKIGFTLIERYIEHDTITGYIVKC